MEKSTHAKASGAIRKALKEKFPNTKFSIRSKSFSGGDSVSISWTDGPTYGSVNAIVKDYQEGSFNAMEDIYEYDNTNNNLPQVKYVLPQREMSDAVHDRIKAELGKKFGVDMDDEQAVHDKMCRWPYEAIRHEFSKTAY